MYCDKKRNLELKPHKYTDKKPECVSGYLYKDKYYTKKQLQKLRDAELRKQSNQFEKEMMAYQLQKVKNLDYKITYTNSSFID